MTLESLLCVPGFFDPLRRPVELEEEEEILPLPSPRSPIPISPTPLSPLPEAREDSSESDTLLDLSPRELKLIEPYHNKVGKSFTTTQLKNLVGGAKVAGFRQELEALVQKSYLVLNKNGNQYNWVLARVVGS